MLRERLPSDPPVVDFQAFREGLEEILACCLEVVTTSGYLRNSPRVDEAYKLERMLVRGEDIERARGLAKELEELVDDIERSMVQVVRGSMDRV